MAQKTPSPSMDAWLKEAKQHPSADQVGMYLTHNGTVRRSAKARVRHGDTEAPDVQGMLFDYDEARADAAVAAAYRMEGIHYIKIWLNRGRLQVGDDIMYVLIGGDTRPHVIDAMQFLVGTLKESCVTETELT